MQKVTHAATPETKLGWIQVLVGRTKQQILSHPHGTIKLSLISNYFQSPGQSL